MGKTALCLTSLVAAVPGAFLAWVAVMAFLNYAGGWSVTIKAVTGLSAAVGGALAVMPVALLVLGRGEKRPATKPPEQEDAPPVDDDLPEMATEPGTGVVAGKTGDEETIRYEPSGEEPEALDLGEDFDFEDEEPSPPKKPK
jgi:hypothetical protein